MADQALRQGHRRPTGARRSRVTPGRDRPAADSVPDVVRLNLRKIGGVPGLRKVLPDPSRTAMVASILEAASDHSRLRILAALAQGPLCPCLLQEISPMNDAVLSYHLKVLKDAGLVARSSVSNFRVYELTTMGRRLASTLSGLPSDS